MTSVDQLLHELRKRDVVLWLEGDRLRYRAAKDALSPSLLAQLKEQKAEVIAFLRQANASTTSQLPAVEPIDRSKSLPLSFAQQRLWFLHQLEPSGTSNNMPVVVRFVGTLDVAVLEQSIQTVVQRQEVLRTRFPAINGQATLVIEDEVTIPLPLIDLRELPEEARDTEALHLATQEARQPFDLANGPILRVKLFQLQDDEYLLIWNMHCIVCDGASSDVFYQDLTAIYRSLVKGEPCPLSDLPVQYADFAHWQRQWLQGEVLESQLSYWKKNLEGNLPVLQLPFDHRRPVGLQTYRGDRGARMLPIALNESLSNLSQQLGGTLFMTLLAAFEVLLYRYSSQEDLLISFASAGRGQVETERLLGFFSNTLMLRTSFKGNPTFRELFNRVKEASLQAYAHQDLPFEKLIEELRPEQSQTRSPLFQVKFALNPPWSKGRGMASVQLPNLTMTSLFGYIYHGKTKYDLTLVMREQDEGLGMVFDYNAEIFDASTIARMIEQFQTLLEGIVANPDQRISDLPLLTPKEQKQLLVDWNPPLVHPQQASITERFEAQVRQSPEAIALVTPDQALTYATLNQQANQLARHLQSLGVEPDTRVGLYFDRSIAAIVSILAVLKAGATYIPLSPDASPEEITHTLANAQAAWVLAERQSIDRLVDYPEKVLCWEEVQQVLHQHSSDNLIDRSQPNSTAHVLYQYKSGSGIETVQALRGVSISHGSVVQLATNNTQLDLSAKDALLQFATLSSEIATFEIFSALLNGCRLSIYPAIAPLQQLGAFIQTQQITTLWLPTRLFNFIVDRDLDRCKSVRNLLTGGDILSVSHARTLQTALPNCSLFNAYSFLENSALTCSYFIPESIPSNAPRLMGRPVGNTQVYVLDKYLKLLPIGAIGELYLSGSGLAQGYFGQPEETAKWFIHNPFSPDTASRLYKTNYLVRYLPDGNLEFAGRLDQQSIIHGYRIDLGEIETTLSQHPALQQCVVVLQEDTAQKDESQNQPLVAYGVTPEPEALDAFELRSFLQKSLPGYMIPAAFVLLGSLPLKPNGKVDYWALPKPDALDMQAANRYDAPRTVLEEQISHIWCGIFQMEQIGIHDNFFDLGGHSLLAIGLVSAMEDTFHKPLPLAALYQVTTIAEMATFLEQEETDHLDESSDDLPPLDETVLRSMLTVVAGRQGGKPRPDSFVTSMRITGSKPPLFFCANRLLELSSLVSYLSEDQPVYFLAVGSYALKNLPPERRPETIEAIAARHIRDMLSIHPEGPYLLAGYCFGSVMAYEIAKQLQAKGKQVVFLGALDYEGIGRRYSHYLNEIEPLLVDVKQELLNGSFSQFILKLKAILGKVKDNFFLKEPASLVASENVCMQGYTGKITLFVPKEQNIPYGQVVRQFLFPRRGWEDHLVELVKLSGSHLSVVYGSGDYDSNNIVHSDRHTRCYADVQQAANRLESKIDEALAVHANANAHNLNFEPRNVNLNPGQLNLK